MGHSWRIVKTSLITTRDNKRNDVHLVSHIQGSRDQPGVRRGSDCVVVVDVRAIYENGMKIYRSKAGVILVSERIPPEFIKEIKELFPGRPLHFRETRTEIPRTSHLITEVECSQRQVDAIRGILTTQGSGPRLPTVPASQEKEESGEPQVCKAPRIATAEDGVPPARDPSETAAAEEGKESSEELPELTTEEMCPNCNRERQYEVGCAWEMCCKQCFVTHGSEHDEWCDQRDAKREARPAKPRSSYADILRSSPRTSPKKRESPGAPAERDGDLPPPAQHPVARKATPPRRRPHLEGKAGADGQANATSQETEPRVVLPQAVSPPAAAKKAPPSLPEKLK